MDLVLIIVFIVMFWVKVIGDLLRELRRINNELP